MRRTNPFEPIEHAEPLSRAIKETLIKSQSQILQEFLYMTSS